MSINTPVTPEQCAATVERQARNIDMLDKIRENRERSIAREARQGQMFLQALDTIGRTGAK